MTESSPLLRDSGEETEANGHGQRSFGERVNSVAQEPLTPLTKILLVLVLALLLTSSVRLHTIPPSQHANIYAFICV